MLRMKSIIAYNLQRILIGFGYQVPETVGSGLKAVRAVDKIKPDLVLMDIQLQGEMDGIEAAGTASIRDMIYPLFT